MYAPISVLSSKQDTVTDDGGSIPLGGAGGYREIKR